MSRGFPSMTALLALLAVAGYQNRDKLAEWLGAPSTAPELPRSPGGADGQQPGGLGGLLSNLGGAGASGGLGGLLGGGLSELVERFKQAGQGDVANSWIGRGPNKEVAPNQLENAIGADTLATLSQQTGLSREEILARLSRELPEAVDKYTPEGRLPTDGDFARAERRSAQLE